ncbi:unnamed protein product [Mytilus edulis]|uniref:CCHC-type domain-containing protein n=1 Tax=Mytilus edulis TaxID=6550 RepID=A0A8S3QEJ3_MYTED|nr:unnamed protein product [Mytilus edulis]
MAVSYLKGLCTRYNNLLAKELDKSGDIIAQGIQDESVTTQLRQVLSAERRLKDFAAKLEDSMKEISLILEEKEDKEGEIVKFTKASEIYFKLLDGVTQRLDELKIFEEEIQDKITDTKKTESATDQKVEHLLQLQTQIQEQILQFQQLQLQELQRKSQPSTERFGNVQSVVNKHYSDLINLQSASNQTTHLRRLYDDLERHLRSLDAMHQDVTQDVFISMITSKLPKEVLIQLEIQKGNNERWTVGKLRQFFNTYITAREAAESQSKETHTGPSSEEKQQSKIQSNNSNFQPRKHLSAEALMTIKPFGKNSGSGNSMVCRYCDGHHWSDECRKFSTIEDRKQKIKGSCYTCLKLGHVSRDCKFEKACYHCKQKKGHHRSLCPKKIPSQQREVSHLPDEMCEIASSEENVPENSLLSSGDIVLMQTAQTTVSKTEVVSLLMDSGSQRTYITENLAKRLNLKKQATEEITLVTFGADKPKTLRTQKVSLKIRLKDGVCMLIDANVVPKITGSILRRPLQMDVCENVKYLCNNLQLADTLPSSLESSTIEILIGNDYYLDIILPQKIKVPFGVISSPFLLAATLDYHPDTYKNATAANIRENIYVDNVITGVDSTENAVTLYKEAKQIFSDASMNLREWASNSQKFLKCIPKEDQANREKLKVLGLTWTIKDDTLTVNSARNDNMFPVTKREVLQRVASVFDPLGFFTPVTLRTKLFLQMLWNKKMEWDEQLTEEDIQQWKEISFDLDEIQEYHIPRAIGLPGTVTFRLLCFCDASTKAYASAVYLHQLREDNLCKIDLLFSKTRLVPNKKITLPRLELLAVVIGVRCIDFVKKQLKLPICETILWTDSQCVLHWIGSKKPLATFVDNRIKEIRQQQDIQFQYVYTKENPADIASRGTTVSLLKENSQWWHGPSWLTKHRTEWPSWDPHNISVDNQNSIESEYKVSKVLHEAKLLAGEGPDGETNSVGNSKSSVGYLLDIDCSRFFSFIRLIRVSAWVLRFVKRLNKETISGPLTAAELEHAKLLWIKSVQKQCFGEVMIAIKENKRHNLVSQLGLILDQENVIRCVDNGSQFKLASKTLEEAWNGVTVDSGVQTYMANEGIQWQFIVELAPWMGGFYERLIGIVKRCLRKTIGKLCLTNEQFRTLLAESEAVVNSRPLVYIGDDINSNIILTPAHFLTLNAKIGFPNHNEEDSIDPEYLPQISSAKKWLLTWKKG